MKTSVNITEILERHIYEQPMSEADWLKILNIVETYSELKTVKNAAKDRKVSVQAIYKNKKTHEFFGTKVVFD